MIPALISQTWRTRELPPEAERLAEGWKRLNPDFGYRLHDDRACAELVAAVAPEHLEDYLRFPFPVMRADYFRLAAVFRDGGFYADIDMECLRPVGPLLGLGAALFSVEARLTARRQRELGYPTPFQIANCVFAARPGHPFLRQAMDRAVALFRRNPALPRSAVEDVTGPRMLTRLFHEKRRADLAVLGQIFLMAPTLYPDLPPLNRNMHARHRAWGSWKEKAARPLSRVWIERDRWPNPFPAGFEETRVRKAEPAR